MLTYRHDAIINLEEAVPLWTSGNILRPFNSCSHCVCNGHVTFNNNKLNLQYAVLQKAFYIKAQTVICVTCLPCIHQEDTCTSGIYTEVLHLNYFKVKLYVWNSSPAWTLFITLMLACFILSQRWCVWVSSAVSGDSWECCLIKRVCSTVKSTVQSFPVEL